MKNYLACMFKGHQCRLLRRVPVVFAPDVAPAVDAIRVLPFDPAPSCD